MLALILVDRYSCEYIVFLKDILEKEVDEKYFLSEKTIATITRHKNKIISEKENPKQSCTIHANYFKMGGRDQQYIVHNMMPRSGDPKKGGTGHLTRTDGKTYCLDTGKTNAVEILGGDFRHDAGFRWRENGKSGILMAQARTDGTAGQALAKIDAKIR